MAKTQEERTRLLIRQLQDIQGQANKIVRERTSASAIETFSKYSEEIKEYILKYSNNQDIHDRVNNIRKIKFKKSQIKLWHIVTFSIWLVWFLQLRGIQKCKEEIEIIRQQYSNLEFLLKSGLNYR